MGALSKGFGEYVEAVQHTPRLTPEEIKALLDDPNERTIVIDVRPVTEYRNMNIPGSTNLPGCEVTYRLAEVVKDPDTTIIINCAGRTRAARPRSRRSSAAGTTRRARCARAWPARTLS